MNSDQPYDSECNPYFLT